MTVLVTRAQWGARPRKQGSNNLVDNPEITIHYEGEGWKWPWDHSTCDDKIRAMQAYHMDGRGWSDIAYNYLACPHNYLFEGRGYDHQSSANGYVSANEQSFAVQAMWGTKASVKVPDDLKRALLFAIDYLVDHGATRTIKGHRDWKSTDCPGDELYAWIKAGCPSPDSNKDWFDMATLKDLETALNNVLTAQAQTDGQPLHELVQMYSAFNAKHDDQLVGTTVNATDTVLKDDFQAIANQVKSLVDNQSEMKSTLDSILQKLNQ